MATNCFFGMRWIRCRSYEIFLTLYADFSVSPSELKGSVTDPGLLCATRHVIGAALILAGTYVHPFVSLDSN